MKYLITLLAFISIQAHALPSGGITPTPVPTIVSTLTSTAILGTIGTNGTSGTTGTTK